MPGVASLRTYERRWLRSDVVAGIVLAAILVPQGMAYAELAGLPAVNGLYTTIACLVGYALMGPSKILVLGPDSSLGPLIFAAIAPLVVAGDDPATAIALAGMLAILVGLIEIGLGVGKLGFVADLLSSEVQVGYMNGLAITIIVGQLPKLCGFSTDADGFVEEVQRVREELRRARSHRARHGPRHARRPARAPARHPEAPRRPRRRGRRHPRHRRVRPRRRHGRHPSQGPPHARACRGPSVGDVVPLLVAAVGITLVSLTDTIALSTSFNARRGELVKPNQEMIGIGSANIAAGFFQGFAVSASSSRTAVAEQSGAKTQLAGVIGAGVVVLLLVFFNGLLADLPNSALAAVVIAAALSLARLLACSPGCGRSDARRCCSRSSPAPASSSSGSSRASSSPSCCRSCSSSIGTGGRTARCSDGCPAARAGTATGATASWSTPTCVVYRWEAPLFFANAGIFADQVRELVQERRPAWVVLQCEAITDIDVTAAGMLKRLDIDLNTQGVHLAFVELRTRLRDLVHDYGLLDTLDREHFYGSIEEALADIGASGAAEPTAP